MTKTNLWPDDIGQVTVERGPATLLKEQAGLLSQLTKGLVEAEVRGEQDPETQNFVDNFYLVATTINYSYLLFKTDYPPTSYPANLYFHPLFPLGVLVADDEDLAKCLADIFDHEKTRQIIGAIIARSK